MPDLHSIVTQLESLVKAAASEQNIPGSDLRRIFRFISKVNQVVTQAFQNVYPILIEITLLNEDDLKSADIKEINRELELLNSRDYYRNVELICGRLRELRDQYDEYIRPSLHHLSLDKQRDFSMIFLLLQDRESYIMQIVEEMTHTITSRLQNLNGKDDLIELKEQAMQMATHLKEGLDELQVMNSRILGLSGARESFLELTETDRFDLEKQIINHFNYVDKSISMGDINNSGNFNIGDNNTQSITNTTNQSPGELINIIELLIQEIRDEQIADEEKNKALRYLEVAKSELKEENPDKGFIGKNMKKVADTLESTGKILEHGSSIGSKIFSVLKWVGVAVSAAI